MKRLRSTVIGLAASIAVLVTFAASGIVSCAAPAPAEWVQFRIDATHNVVLDSPLEATWTSVTGGPISSSPAVTDTTLYIGNNRGYLSAIDLRTGQTLWSKHLSNALMSQPLLYNGTVIVGEGDEQSQG